MKYIGFFDTELNKNENRHYHMSAKNKMLYIANAISELDINVEIISPSWTKNNNSYKGKTFCLNESINLILGPTIPYKKYFSTLWSIMWLTFILLKNTQRYETIIVYHSLPLMLPIMLLKKIKKINVVLEVEEIYSDVWKDKEAFYDIEIKYIKNINHRIFVSKKLKSKIGSDKDVVLYGGYINKRDHNISRINNSMVYAGSIEKIRGGAFTAVEAMRYMSRDDVTLYILGTGDLKVVESLKSLIEDVNTVKGYKAVTFLGEKNGEDFVRTMNKFQVGLNLQNKGKYMDSAFPSKILTYLSYNQRVISTDIDSIVNSPFADYINFVKGSTPEELAEEVSLIIDFNNLDNDSSTIIEKFHNQFKNELKSII